MASASTQSSTKASPPASRPASPSPSRSGFRTLARMGTMLRRNSSGFSFGRQTISRSTSKSSLRVDPSSAEEAASAPSPVPESPAREAAAMAAEPTGAPPVHYQSPLSHEAKATPDPSPAPPPPMALVAEPEPTHDAPDVMPEQQPPATIPEPQASVSPEPPVLSPPLQPPASTPEPPAPAPAPAVTAPPPAPAPAPAPVPSAPASHPIPEAAVVLSTKEESVSSPEIVRAEPEAISKPPSVVHEEPLVPEHPPATIIEERGADYFAWNNIPITAAKKASSSSLNRQSSVPVAVAPATTTTSVPISAPEPRSDPYAASAADSFAWKDETMVISPRRSSSQISKMPSHEQLVASPKQSLTSLSRAQSREQLVASPHAMSQELVASPHSISHELSPKASKSSLASSYGQVVSVSTGSRRVSVSLDPGAEPIRGRSRSRASIRVSFDDPYTDPFADPPSSNQMPIPKQALSPIYSVDTPMLEHEEPSVVKANAGLTFPQPQPNPIYEEPESTLHEATPAPISMPLPELNEVSHTRVIHQQPSAYSIGESSGIVDHAPHETDERLPLLPRMPSPSVSKAPEATFSDITIGGTSANGIPWPSVGRTFTSLGWTQHILPDSTIYYSHQDLRVTTDIDLRNEKRLEAVMQYLNAKGRNGSILPPPGWELWLRDASRLKYDFNPVKGFVNHNERVLTFEMPQAVDVGALSEDDRLDSEYRYWTYMESHPAHAPLPLRAHTEAMDALRWCYTDCVLPSQQSGPPLFAPQECQELMGLLRSFGEDAPGTSIVHTHIVSRVLLRKAQWRQKFFRPDKPLPGDASRSVSDHRISFRRAFLDIIVSILCLGIPYLFMGRSLSRRIDEEGGMRSQSPLLVIGACSCLVAAVILSASVTFLTLPGLDDIARLASMIAILFSASSMVSAVVALFKYKADLDRTVVYVGGEGLMILSRRSIVMSLPIVFLAWAIAAFITGITFYSFRGVTLTSKVVIKQPFTDYTHWAVVGSLGGLAGMLLMSILLSRR